MKKKLQTICVGYHIGVVFFSGLCRRHQPKFNHQHFVCDEDLVLVDRAAIGLRTNRKHANRHFFLLPPPYEFLWSSNANSTQLNILQIGFKMILASIEIIRPQK